MSLSRRLLDRRILLLCGLGLASCAPPNLNFSGALHLASDSDILKITDFDLRSKAAFEAKLHPLLKQHCSGCHRSDSGVPGSGYPHSDSSVEVAHNTVTLRHYVDYSTPSASRFMQVVQQGQHPVQLPATVAGASQQFLAAITSWNELRGPDPDAVLRTADFELPAISSMPALPATTTIAPTSVSLGALMQPQVSDAALMPSLGFTVSNFNGIYRISALRVRNPVAQGGPLLRVKGISVHLNGQLVASASGFKLVDYQVPRSTGTSSQATYATTITTTQQEVFVIPSCTPDSPPGCKEQLSFSFDVIGYPASDPFAGFKAMVVSNCAGCHNTAKQVSYSGLTVPLPAFGSNAALQLTQSAYVSQFGPGFIVPGNPVTSVLYQAILPTSQQQSAGIGPMPTSGSLQARQGLAAIAADWINSLNSGSGGSQKALAGDIEQSTDRAPASEEVDSVAAPDPSAD